ncbi:MAG: hypothetical protein ACYC2T_02065 [Bacillota bacterium]
MSVSAEQGQAMVFAVESSDPNVVYVEIGPPGARVRKEIKINTPVIFSWKKVIQFNDLKPVALSKEGTPLYEYKYPENKNTIFAPEDLKWYPTILNKSVPASTLDPASVNTAAFKGMGKLVFVWGGLLYTLDGHTGYIHQLPDIKSAIHPIWSFDGQWIAYLVPKENDNNSSGTLWVARSDGSRAHQVDEIKGDIFGFNFAWSPTANILAALDYNEGLWVMPVDGVPRVQVRNNITRSFAWSPDGKLFAFSVNIPVPGEQFVDSSDALHTIAIDSFRGEQHLIVPKAGIQVAGWWPDGNGILYWVQPFHSSSLAADGVALEKFIPWC